jgi:hypothetical protein
VAATAEYREDTDPLEGLFAAGVLVEDHEARTSTTELYAAYQAWAQTANVPLDRRYGQDGFAKALAGRFQRVRMNGNGPRGFAGVRVGNLPAEAT